MEQRLKIRSAEIDELKSYVTKINDDVSTILQGFQWDLKHILERLEMVTCAYNKNHRIPLSSKETHERRCVLALHGYSEQDKLLPETAQSGIKLSKHEIQDVINKAAWNDPMFKKGVPTNDVLEPQTLERLQATYTSDERRAIYDAVVAAAPSIQDDFNNLPLPASNNEPGTQTKTREQVLAELRDMKRRRAKYRGASRTANYSDALRDLISTQMELYTGAPEGNSQNEIASTSVVVKQEPGLEKPSTVEKNTSVHRYYDRAVDRNLLYARDRSRSRSRERKTFVDRRFIDRRVKNQRNVYSKSPSKEIKQERSVSRQRFDDRHDNRRPPERSYKDISHSRRRSRERSHDRTERRREKEDTRSRDKFGSGSKHSTDSSRRDVRSRHRDNESKNTDIHSDRKYETDRSDLNSRDRERHRRRDEREKRSSSKHTEPKRYYDV